MHFAVRVPVIRHYSEDLTSLHQDVIVIARRPASLGPVSYTHLDVYKRQDYVRTARAKGVSDRAILFKHVLRNALIPVITLIGLSLPGIVAGAVITEYVFNYPGMGLLFIQAADGDDFPVLLGVTVVVGIATVMGSLIADILYAVADPRIRRCV